MMHLPKKVVDLYEKEAKAQKKMPEKLLLNELIGGLKAKLELYKKKVEEFEEKYGIKFKTAAKKFEGDNVGYSELEHQCYFDYLFLKGALEEKKEIKKQLRILKEYEH